MNEKKARKFIFRNRPLLCYLKTIFIEKLSTNLGVNSTFWTPARNWYVSRANTTLWLQKILHIITHPRALFHPFFFTESRIYWWRIVTKRKSGKHYKKADKKHLIWRLRMSPLQPRRVFISLVWCPFLTLLKTIKTLFPLKWTNEIQKGPEKEKPNIRFITSWKLRTFFRLLAWNNTMLPIPRNWAEKRKVMKTTQKSDKERNKVYKRTSRPKCKYFLCGV